MKILHVINISFVIPSFFGNQFKYLEKKAIESHVICTPSDELEPLSNLYHFKYKEINIKRSFNLREDFMAIYKIYKYILANNIDIVVGHTPKGALLGIISAWLAHVNKRIFFRHGLAYETSKGIKKLILINVERLTSNLSTKIVCVSPYLIEKSIKDKLSPMEKMMLLNRGSCNGINAKELFNPDNIDTFKLNFLKRNYSISQSSFVIGFVGRLTKDKGIEELIDSFTILQRQHSNIKLLILGPIDERVGISKEYLKILQQNKYIIAPGFINNDLPYYYSMMDIFVLPTHREGFGNVIIEASSMQLPVLTTSHTGSRDAIINGVTGKYIHSVENIVDTINYYITNKDIRIQHGVNGRNFVLENFSEEIIWKELEKIYI